MSSPSDATRPPPGLRFRAPKGKPMFKDIRQQVGDREDDNQIYVRGIAVVIFLVVAAVAVNAFFWSADPTPAIADTAIRRPAPDPAGNQAPK